MTETEKRVVNYAITNGFITSFDGFKVGTVDIRKTVSDLRRNPNYEVTDDWDFKRDKDGKVIKRWKRYYIREVVANG